MILHPEEQAKLDRRAAELAGPRSNLNPLITAVFCGTAVYMMLMVFSTVTGPGPESAGFAIFVFTVAAGGGVYYLIDGQDTVWLNRRDRFYRKLLAERELQEERSRKMGDAPSQRSSVF